MGKMEMEIKTWVAILISYKTDFDSLQQETNKDIM